MTSKNFVKAIMVHWQSIGKLLIAFLTAIGSQCLPTLMKKLMFNQY